MTDFIRTSWARLLIYAAHYPNRLALLAGAFLPLGFAPFYLLPIYYLAMAGFFALLWQAQHQSCHKIGHIRRQAWLGFCFGFGQFFVGLIWIGEAFLVEAELFLWILPFAIIFVSAGFALFTALASAVSGALVGRFALPKMAALMSYMLALSLTDWGRAHLLTGFPWNQPEQIWSGVLPLAQNLAFWGAHGSALLVMLSAVLLAMARPRMVLLAVLLPLFLAALGGVRLYFYAPTLASTTAPALATPFHNLQIILVQPNINQREKWQPQHRQRHIDKVMQLTLSAVKAAPQNAQNRLIIWPETALPALLDESSHFADLLRTKLPPDTWVLTGAVRRQATPDRKWAYYNSTQLWHSTDGLRAVRDKYQLVPFGEYLPLQNWLEAIGLQQLTRLRGGYRAGLPYARITAPDLPLIAPLVCYEAIFPHLSASSGTMPRPDVLINITNDAWFGQYLGPYQHFAQTRLRAIEQGVPLIRVANTGISALFDAQGRVSARLALGQSGTQIIALPPTIAPPLYARFGDGIYALMLIFLSAFTLYLRKCCKTD